MGSGMTESTSGTVILNEVDSVTFIQFAEYLHSGTYTTVPAETCSVKPERSFAPKCADFKQKLLVTHAHITIFDCIVCQRQANIRQSLDFPYHNEICKNAKQKPVFTPTCIWCIKNITDHEFICKKCEDTVPGVTNPVKLMPKGWSQFMTKGFGASRVKERAASQNSQGSQTVTINLSAHAKVWVLADRYQVPALMQLSLRRLHRDLIEYELKPEGAKAVVRLIEYVYENSFTPEPKSTAEAKRDGKGCELRDLVMAYAACRAETLVETQAFCIMLQKGGDLASDFAKALLKRGD